MGSEVATSSESVDVWRDLEEAEGGEEEEEEEEVAGDPTPLHLRGNEETAEMRRMLL